MFSVIMPVFNSEKTVEDTLTNILKNFSFKNDELIIINDGSTDNTEKILQKYKYNDSVKIYTQTNKGVSAARNFGIAKINWSNKFIIFIDDSDKLSNKFIQSAYDFFELNQDMKLAIAPIKLLKDGQVREQSFKNDEIYRNKIININEIPNAIHYHIGGVVFRSDIFLDEKLKFDENANYFEDAKLINKIIIKEGKYGILQNSFYLYDRNNVSSLSNTIWENEQNYINLIKKDYHELIDLSLKVHGKVIKYIQYLLLNHYMNFIYYNNNKIFFEKKSTKELFEKLSIELFESIDKNIIMNSRFDPVYKSYLLKLKGLEYICKSQKKVYLQSVDFKNISISFSKSCFNIDEHSDVYIKYFGKNIIKMRKKSKNYNILSKKVNDFSMLKFHAKLSFSFIFINAIIIVDNNNNKLSFKLDSLIVRLIKKFLRRKSFV